MLTIERKAPDLLPSKGFQRAFLAGSVEPDLSISQFIVPHFWTKSKDVIYERIDNLFDKSELYLWDMFKMGQICHYLCDYCCYVHMNGIGDPKEHWDYECELQRVIFANTEEYKKNLFHIEPTDSFILLTDAIIKEYRKGELNHAKDLELAMTLSSMFLYNLLLGENVVDPAKDLEELVRFFVKEFNLVPQPQGV